MDKTYDCIVIGGGPAGYVSAIRSAKLGMKTALIEKDSLGGTCLNRGCIPTKSYVKNIDIIHSINNAHTKGIDIVDKNINIDLKKSVDYKNSIVKKLVSGVSYLIKSNKIDLYYGEGKIIGKTASDDVKKVSVSLVDNKNKSICINSPDDDLITSNDRIVLKSKNIILATGSKTTRLNIEGSNSKLVMTSDEILDLTDIPKSLTIIGAGVIGLEMAMVYNSYGTKVNIIEIMDRPLPNMDEEVSKYIYKLLKKEGIEFNFETTLDKFLETDGKITSVTNKGSFTSDLALISIGRTIDDSAFDDICLEKLDFDRGKVKVNEFMETSVHGIYAPGDVNGMLMLAHSAFKMGEIAAENIYCKINANKFTVNKVSKINKENKKSRINLNHIPSAIYLHPEVASIGLTENQAREKYDISVGKFNLSSNSMAVATGETDGFVKVIVDKKYGEILGVHIIGRSASEIVNEAAQIMSSELTVYEAINSVHTHPSISEALLEALMDTVGQSIHLPAK